MADKVELDDATLAKIDRLEKDVAEIKHLLKAMATAFGMREVIEGNAAVEAKQEQDKQARQEFEESRTKRIQQLLAWVYEGPRGAACRKWLEERLGTEFGPLRDDDIARYSALQDPPD